ncbi:MAG: acyl-CoA thioesterase [Candidatus Sumerlaeota bacterium]|nr:acyl-CoA thioesterase [Candidatus Sumerlaeota bacterium]
MNLRAQFEHDRFAAHAGIELVEGADGRAIVRMAIREEHLNSVDTVHGGAIFTLADFAFAVASNSHGRVAMGISTTIQYVRAVPGTGAVLRAIAEETSISHRIATYTVRVVDDADNLVALFIGTVYRKGDALPHG